MKLTQKVRYHPSRQLGKKKRSTIIMCLSRVVVQLCDIVMSFFSSTLPSHSPCTILSLLPLSSLAFQPSFFSFIFFPSLCQAHTFSIHRPPMSSRRRALASRSDPHGDLIWTCICEGTCLHAHALSHVCPPSSLSHLLSPSTV
jgi:hypothetical protein